MDLKTRKDKEINIDNFKNFHARRRWKHSMKVVALCNKLSRSKQSLKAGEEPITQPETVVSNNTTGKTAEVRLAQKKSPIFVWQRSVQGSIFQVWYNLYPSSEYLQWKGKVKVSYFFDKVIQVIYAYSTSELPLELPPSLFKPLVEPLCPLE